ncbi:MAG: hydrolase 2, exosortase A system-associated [Rubrivivax sp.]|nr:hydrolase 2, exosortase A system-associated [Rubrivivax sp.]
MKAMFRDGTAPLGGRRLLVVHEPGGVPRGVVVGVAAFAEEMNKGRRTASLAARAMARAGLRVVQLDMAGCGDSSGDLVSATWQAWVDDLLDTAQWAASQAPAEAPLILWGIRAGCLVASQAQAQLGSRAHLMLWQPQSSGKLVLQQFLRLKMAGQLQQGAAKGVTDSLLATLAAGGAVEVAGYALGPGVTDGLAAAQLRPPAHGTRVSWLEVSAQTPPELLPASQTIVQKWRDGGVEVRAAAVGGPLFWQSQDIEEAPALVELTAIEAGTLCETTALA